eukprot:895354-Rhodomonas_salina.2
MDCGTWTVDREPRTLPPNAHQQTQNPALNTARREEEAPVELEVHEGELRGELGRVVDDGWVVGGDEHARDAVADGNTSATANGMDQSE